MQEAANPGSLHKSCQRPFRHVTAPFHYHSTVTETCFLCELRAEAASEDEEEEAEVLDGKGGGCSRGGGSPQDNYDYFLQLSEPNT